MTLAPHLPLAVLGSTMLVNLFQPFAFIYLFLVPIGTVNFDVVGISSKTPYPNVTEAGFLISEEILFTLIQPLKEYFSIFEIVLGILTEVNSVIPEKANQPIEVTPDSMTTD